MIPRLKLQWVHFNHVLFGKEMFGVIDLGFFQTMCICIFVWLCMNAQYTSSYLKIPDAEERCKFSSEAFALNSVK